MKKSIIMILLFSLSPILVYAQSAGGEVRRHDKGKEPVNDMSAKKQKSKQITMSENQRQTIIQNLINNMVYVEGGTFLMGATVEQADDAWEDETPIHQVTLSSFYIGRYEVTQQEWQAVMGNNPSKFKGAKQPVGRVSWNDCQLFIRKLNTLTGRQFRLPTEAEWEFAARGGKKSRGYKYAGSNDLDKVAWHWSNCSGKTHEVGQKLPNELGLYDMNGNVEEWCQDWFAYYSSSNVMNPKGPSSGSTRVFRGGCVASSIKECHLSDRCSIDPSERIYYMGLRLAYVRD